MDPLRALALRSDAGLPVVRGVVRAGLARVFGPPPFDPADAPGDPGLHGPGSASWRIVAEPAAIVGGVRSLLVQLLNPLAMAGVAGHSSFRADPLGRLHRTSAYVTATTFGSTRDALAAARRVRGAHVPVRGEAPDGRTYRAGDPELLTWVSIALTASFLATDAAYAPEPAPPAVADAFVAEQALAASLLDPRIDLAALGRDRDALAALRRGEHALPMVAEGLLPTSVGALHDRFAAFRGALAVDDAGRETVRFLLWPPLPTAVRAGYLPMLSGAIATLDPWQQSMLGIPAPRVARWTVRAQTRGLLRAFRLATGVSPSLLAARARAAA